MALFAGALLRTIECVMVTTSATFQQHGEVLEPGGQPPGMGCLPEGWVRGVMADMSRCAWEVRRCQAQGADGVLPVHPSGGG